MSERTRTIGIMAGFFIWTWSMLVVGHEHGKRVAELENTSDQARQYIQNAREREHRINELEVEVAALRAMKDSKEG